MPKRTIKKLASAATAQLRESYDLVYVDQGDKLTTEQTAAIIRGDMDALWESTTEWEMEARDAGVENVIIDLVREVIRTWEQEDNQDYTDLSSRFHDSRHALELRDTISERDSGSWARELIQATPPALLRITVFSEEGAYDNQEVDPAEALAKVGLPVTEGNLTIMEDTLANASPQYSVLFGYWIIGADVEQVYDLPHDTQEVTITNPHLYLGNPFAGSGFVSQDPFEGTVIAYRSDLLTDKEAFGYSVEEMMGGVTVSAYRAEIAPLAPQERVVIGTRGFAKPSERSPIIVATRGGAGDVEVQVTYDINDGKQVIHIDTEDAANFHVRVNGKPATLTINESE